MKRKLTAGLTGASIPIFVRDTSSSTGAGLSSLVFNTSGLVAEFRRQGAATWTAITLVSGTLGTWASGGFVADGALAGAYEVDLPDAILASGARWVAIRLRGAANMLPVLIEVELDVVNYQSATAFITGVNSLAPPTNWNLEVIDANGRVDVSKLVGQTVTAAAGVTFPASIGTSTLGGTAQTGDAFARLGAAGAGLTALGDTRIANLDATVSSRGTSTYAGGAISGVTGVTFPSTVPSLVQIQGGLPTDTTIAADVQTGLTAQGYTTGRAVFLDTLNGLVAAIWNTLTSALTTAGSIGKRLNDFVTTLVYAAPTTPPTVVQVRQEMDSNSTQLAAIVTGVAGVPNAVLDLANGIETSMTLRQAMRALVAMGVGKSTETAGTLVFKRQDGTTTAFSIVHDSLGSRTGSSIGSL